MTANLLSDTEVFAALDAAAALVTASAVSGVDARRARDQEIARLVAQGVTRVRIAHRLGLTEGAVRAVLRRAHSVTEGGEGDE